MFDQSYEQIYRQRQIIALGQTYPCPRCKLGALEPFGDTETFACNSCHRNYVALNAGRILYPAYRLKVKIAPVFWWDGLRWHIAGTTASSQQVFFVTGAIALPLLLVNIFVFAFHQGQPAGLFNNPGQNFWLNLSLLNVLICSFMMQVLYLLCWDKNWHSRRALRHNSAQRK